MTLDQINQMLIDAAHTGKILKVKRALKLGADIHAKSDDALRLAAMHGHKDIVELLLDNGADVHARSDEALRWAAGDGYKEVVELLLERNADIHAMGDLALLWAVHHSRQEPALVLLRHGGNLKARDYEGKDLFNGTQLAEWLKELKQETSEHFQSGKPSREQCFTAGKLDNQVLDACVTEQFTTLIGAPLIASTDKADRQLFQDIWDALPPHWQDQNQGIYMQFAKEGGLNPILGQHTTAAQRDSVPPDSRMER